MTRAEDLIAKAAEQKAVFLQEVALEAEESKPTLPSEPGVMELQRRIEELVRDRDALRVPMQGVWCADGPPCVNAIVPISKLRNVLEFGDTTTIAKLGELVAQGTSAMGSFAATVSLDGTSRSTLMSAVIDQAEAKRRCLAVGSDAPFLTVVGNRV